MKNISKFFCKAIAGLFGVIVLIMFLKVKKHIPESSLISLSKVTAYHKSTGKMLNNSSEMFSAIESVQDVSVCLDDYCFVCGGDLFDKSKCYDELIRK